MKVFAVLALVSLSAPLLAQTPTAPGACPQQVVVRALPFFTPDPLVVMSRDTLADITRIRLATKSSSVFTPMDQLGKALLADSLFRAAYDGAHADVARAALQRLAGQLLQPQSEDYIVLLVALTELHLLRKYTTRHVSSLERMAQIIDSDTYYGERESLIRQKREITLVHRLIMYRDDNSVAELMIQYYTDQHSTDPAPHPK